MSTDRLNLQRFRDRDDSGEQAWLWLEASRIAARQGDLNEAHRLLRASVEVDPGCAEAWLGLAWLARDRRERKALLHRVLELEPGHVQARTELARLQQPPRRPAKSAGSGAAPGGASPATKRAKATSGVSRLQATGPGGPRSKLQSNVAVPVQGKGEKLPHAQARPATSGTNSHRLGRWVLVLATLISGLLLVAVLALGPVDASLAWLVPTAAPTAVPTPTLTPGQIAAKFEPQLQTALATGDWDRALEIIAIMEGVDPSGEQVRQWAVATHMQYGQALVEAMQADEAQVQFDQAVALAPENAEAHLWQETTQTYLAAEAALEAGQWDAAIESFTLAQEQLPDYDDLPGRLLQAHRLKGLEAVEDGEWTVAIEALTLVHDRAPNDQGVIDPLAEAYRQRGFVQQEEGNLTQARSDLEAALALRPDDAEAQTHLDQVMYILFPPKRIEIDISRQRFYAFEGDTLVYSFATSTGLRGRDTATGHFQVLDKMPMAYSSVWNLKMPYWLGIYYVANIENGIHALPIRPDGSVMWGGLLGQRASYGCVILSTEAARIIYDWAEIGMKVDIYN